MESNYELKETNIKNRTCSYSDYIITLKILSLIIF